MKAELQGLVDAALARLAALNADPSTYPGPAVYSTADDEVFTSLDAFAPAVDALASDSMVQERYGANEATRLALQFVYAVNRKIGDRDTDNLFERTWVAFVEELETDHWKQIGVANLRNIQAEETLIDLGDSVSVRGRSEEELHEAGFSPGVWRAMEQEWRGPGASPYVIWAEHRFEKGPENFLLTTADPVVKAQRALGALRLLGSGDVSMSQMWLARSAKFNVGVGGIQSTGWGLPGNVWGSDYELTNEIANAVPGLYEQLRILETQGYGRGAGNLDLALRSFMATYDRAPAAADSQLVDAITALESVLGSGTEIAFKLAFRVAGIIAADDGERRRIFTEVKRFYDTRSAIVHGGTRKPKHIAQLQRIDELRDVVRRILRGMVYLATADAHEYTREFFQAELDIALQQEPTRAAFRSAMGFV